MKITIKKLMTMLNDQLQWLVHNNNEKMIIRKLIMADENY